MPEYDFATLSPYDFELLVRDLLQADRKIPLENFKSGRDNGIDLRYAPTLDQQLIVQCKHYAESGYSKLLSKLRLEEVHKIRLLKPQHYILATSVGLTPNNKAELEATLQVVVSGTVEVIGKEGVNNLLGQHDEVERRHYKLWLASTTALQQVLHSSVFNQTSYDLESIRRKMRLYVQSKSFPEACEVLEEFHVCIISGVPGIGKTTLAEILLVHYMEQGYSVRKISSDISEASQTDVRDANIIFYYDDFLGQTSIYDKFNKNEDDRLIRFIEWAGKAKGKRFVLTTREYILNQAGQRYERVAQANFDLIKLVVDLAKYSRRDRARILLNHLYFAGISDEYINALISTGAHLKIIDHKNYSPRVIEWMTDRMALSAVSPDQYAAEFLNALDDPARIWEHAYRQQITSGSRFVLVVLSSFPDGVLLSELHMATRHFAEGEAFASPISSVADFQASLKELDGSFISIASVEHYRRTEQIIRPHNPSVRDFLQNQLSTDIELIKTLLERATYFEQFTQVVNIATSSFDHNCVLYIAKNAIPVLKRVLDSQMTRFGLISDSTPDGYGISFGRQNREELLEITIKAANRLPELIRQELYEYCAQEFEHRLSKSLPTVSEAVSLLKALDNNTLKDDVKQNLVSAVWANAMKAIEDLQDFSGILECLENYSKYITEEQVEIIRDSFEQHCNSIDPGTFDTASELEHHADLIRDLGEYFDMDVMSLVDEMLDRIPPDRYDDDDGQRVGGNNLRDFGHLGDGEIDAMFGGLLQ